MTGKELIIYILKNNLENEKVLSDGFFIGFMTEEEAAVKFEVGVETVRMWYALGIIKGYKIGETVLYLRDTPSPRSLEIKINL